MPQSLGIAILAEEWDDPGRRIYANTKLNIRTPSGSAKTYDLWLWHCMYVVFAFPRCAVGPGCRALRMRCRRPRRPLVVGSRKLLGDLLSGDGDLLCGDRDEKKNLWKILFYTLYLGLLFFLPIGCFVVLGSDGFVWGWKALLQKGSEFPWVFPRRKFHFSIIAHFFRLCSRKMVDFPPPP